jgi:hypothetical protein
MSPATQPQVLLVAADPHCRDRLEAVLRGGGFEVAAVQHIAEIERWPIGEIVVVDACQFTPWWAVVGAAHIVVLSDTTDGAEQIRSGVPSTWIPRQAGPEALVSVLRSLPTD